MLVGGRLRRGRELPVDLLGVALSVAQVHGGSLTARRRGGERTQPVERAIDECLLQLQPLAVTQLLGVAINVRRELVRPLAVGDRLQQEVDERLVGAEGEHLVGVALVRVHLPLVLEQLRVEAKRVEVLHPLALHVSPDKVELGMSAVGLFELLLVGAELALELRPVALGASRQRVERERVVGGAQRVPGLAQVLGVGGVLAPTPLIDLAGEQSLRQRLALGGHAPPLQDDVAGVAREDEVLQRLRVRVRAQDELAPGQQHREQQLEQHALAAAVLQEEHRPARRVGVAVAEVEQDVLVAGALGADRLQQDAVELVHGLPARGACVVGDVVELKPHVFARELAHVDAVGRCRLIGAAERV